VGYNDPAPIVAEWRAQAEANGWSLRETVINQQNRQTFIGSPETIAAEMDHHVQEDAADGFVLVPHLTPGGLDDFVDRVVPLLRDRGVFRTSYSGTTLRDHLGLSVPSATVTG
jgi:alkanesulfonate monooxygenase SsuD/methylene tetrahydromethanopterin reductase-like flavin-dependent oxidoreductase (luciferase family)